MWYILSMIKRELENVILENLFKKKVVIILGARQVGKTTLLHSITNKLKLKTLWLNGDEADIRELLKNANTTTLKQLIGNKKIIVIDEAQRIENIGLTVKIIVDLFQDKQVLLSGSSSLELSNSITEPLTGRKFEYNLFTISYKELVKHTSFLEEMRVLEHRLIFGQYPDVINNLGNEKEVLLHLASSYLYKDIFTYDAIKKPAVLEKLLTALALQLGSEVKYNELAGLIGIDKGTIEKYIDLLEKSFVIFKLKSFSRNMRNEIKKGKKIYFYDIGVRNAIIKNFAPISLRNDVGALFENYLILERIKKNHYSKQFVNHYFWRTHSQQEIDLIEEKDGKLFAYEFKWNANKKPKLPSKFKKHYENVDFKVITKENYHRFIG